MTNAPVYSLDKLMAQTRRLAADYYKATQQTLPVSSELANYDAIRLLDLQIPQHPIRGVDALYKDKKIQIKARVVFKENIQGYRLGQIQPDGLWDTLILVLFDSEYEPDEIYTVTREIILANIGKQSKRQSRGAMSVARFKAIAQLVWTKESGLLGPL